jgi:hypothetical protein
MRYEVMSDKNTVWINGPDGMSRARYSHRNQHIDVHHSAVHQIQTGEQCLACGSGTWEDFKLSVSKNLGIELTDEHRHDWRGEITMESKTNTIDATVKTIILDKLESNKHVLAVAANDHPGGEVTTRSRCSQAHSLASAAMKCAREHTRDLYNCAQAFRTEPFEFDMTVDDLRCVFIHKPYEYTFAVVIRPGSSEFSKSFRRVIRSAVSAADKACVAARKPVDSLLIRDTVPKWPDPEGMLSAQCDHAPVPCEESE